MKTPEITVEKTPQKTSHSESTPTRQNKPNKEPLHCQMCGEKFYKKTDLDNHYKHMHKDYKPFQCPLCFSFYRVRNDLIFFFRFWSHFIFVSLWVMIRVQTVGTTGQSEN
jgi:hypothetical protein